MRIAMTLLALALATTGCKKKEATPTGENVGSGSAIATTDDAGGGDMAGAGGDAGTGGDMAGDAGAGAGAGDLMSKQAGNCPSTVLGSTTKAELKGKDIVLTITSDDKDAVPGIQLRAEAVVKEKQDKAAAAAAGGATAGAHDQKGTHGGTIGLCPVHIPEGATAKVKKDKKGATITITPKDNAEALKTEIDARITKAADWVKANIKPGDKGNKGGVGGGTNKEGANHSGQGDGKGMERKKGGTGSGGGEGTGGGGGAGTGGGGSKAGGSAGSAAAGDATK